MAKGRKKLELSKISGGNKEILLDVLAENKIETVVVSFDGSGDDGSLEGSDLPEEVKKIFVEGCRLDEGTVWIGGKPQRRHKNGGTVEEIVQSLCYEVLETLYGGWENNDGAFGEFTFNVEKRNVTLDFNARYVESELYEHQF